MYGNRQISSRAIRRYQQNEIGSVVVKNESPKVGQISGKHDRKIYYMMHDYVELLKIPEDSPSLFNHFEVSTFENSLKSMLNRETLRSRYI